MMNILDSFSEFLNEKLLASSVCLRDFSSSIFLPEPHLSRWINKKCSPSLPSLIKVADVFNVSIEHILDFSVSPSFIKSTLNEDFSVRLKSLLAERSLTAYRVAKDCGMGGAAISKWLLRQARPTPDNVLVLSRYFCVTFDYLIGRED